MRKSGVLLPITSLPSPYGIGCMGKTAYEFVDFLKSCGQSYWQILPPGHTGYGDSPYQCFSAFGGNPYMISPEELVKKGLITKDECEKARIGNRDGCTDYGRLYKNRYPLLRRACAQSNHKRDEDFLSFFYQNRYWLEDYSLFMSLKGYFGEKSFKEWECDIKRGKNKEKYKLLLRDDIDFWIFVQYQFFCQWKKLKEYANSRGIEIIGDMPIYVSCDSSDMWANPHLFRLDNNLEPTLVAGCPPDGFSPKGQLWGNPTYNWAAHKREGYKWWIQRIQHSLQMFDMLRIDHFRGFESYYAIPAGNKDASVGTWEKGPGMELFDAVESTLGRCPVIAEDLGFITDRVRKLLRDTGFYGTRVLELAFDSEDKVIAEYLPKNFPPHSVAYTGTHDNEPIESWYISLSEKGKKNVHSHLGSLHTFDSIYKSLIAEVMMSPSDIAIIPMWDLLGLGSEARINTPGTTGGNWTWRLSEQAPLCHVSQFLIEITQKSKRN